MHTALKRLRREPPCSVAVLSPSATGASLGFCLLSFSHPRTEVRTQVLQEEAESGALQQRIQ